MGRADAAFSDYWVLWKRYARPQAWDPLAGMSKSGPGHWEVPGRGCRVQTPSFVSKGTLPTPALGLSVSQPILISWSFFFLTSMLFSPFSKTACIAELWEEEAGRGGL